MTFVWNPTGFHIIDILHKGSKLNAHHYISVVLQSFIDWLIGKVRTIDRKLVVHADNARLHMTKLSLAFIKENTIKGRHIRLIPRI
jgi:hypothetical protein